MHVDLLQPDDLARTAELHSRHLRVGLFPRLGEDFLRVYHASFAKSPYGIALVARSRDRISGTLFGTTSNRAHYRWVIRNEGLTVALHGGAALLVRPRVAWSFVRTRLGRYAKGITRQLRPRSADPQPEVGAVSVLSHIVTSERERGQGVGRELVEAFTAQLRAKGARNARLVTAVGGSGVPFFERLGCELVSERRDHDGRPIREYQLPLEGPRVAPAIVDPRHLAA